MRLSFKLSALLLLSVLLLGALLFSVLSFSQASSPLQEGAQTLLVKASPAVEKEFVTSVSLTGSLVPREEILILPEVEGLLIKEILVDEGASVTKGQVLLRLSREILDVQLLQNAALLAKSDSAIQQAQNRIVQAEAVLTEASQALKRARTLKNSGNTTDVQLERSISQEQAASAQLAAEKNGLLIAEADKRAVQAQRDELLIRLAKTDIRSPDSGIISRRTARIGATASAAGLPLFRIIAKGEIEFDADIPSRQITSVSINDPFFMRLSNGQLIEGHVRLISPEVDKATRLGRIRITLPSDPALRIGDFFSGAIETGRTKRIIVPRTALLDGGTHSSVFIVHMNNSVHGTALNGATETPAPNSSSSLNGTAAVVEKRTIATGSASGSDIPVLEGLKAGELVVLRAGAFLADGDQTRVIVEPVGN